MRSKELIPVEPRACAECGHLHFFGRERGYGDCPIDECDCKGQEWAWKPRLRDPYARGIQPS